MAASFARNLHAVWLARWQEIAPRLAFWLALAGYDVRDRSCGDLLYLPYLFLFWLFWAFAMFTALSGSVATLLETVAPANPALLTAAAGFWALLAWTLLSLFRALRRSPLIFSPADAALLCQTAVDRRAVALVWFLTEWPLRVLPFAAGALLAGFSLFEVAQPVEAISPLVVFGYTLSGLRALSIVLPLHFFLMALVWALGAWRLHGRQAPALGRWLLPGLFLLGTAMIILGWQTGPVAIVSATLVTRPLLAATGLAPLEPALLLTVALSSLALLVLLLAARRLNLSRAAQETSRFYGERYLARAGAREAARQLKQERRLGSSRRHTLLPAGSGWRAPLWKDTVRAERSWRSALWPWLGLLGVSVGLLVAPDWGSRLVALVFWAQWAANRTTTRLGNNLSHWWLWRQQPFGARQQVALSLGPPLLLFVLLAPAAWIIARLLPLAPNFAIAPLLPFLAPVVVLAAAWDLLRRVEPGELVAGNVPAVSVWGWFVSLIVAALPLGLAWIVTGFTTVWEVGLGAGVLLSLFEMALLSGLLANVIDRQLRLEKGGAFRYDGGLTTG